MARQLPGCHPFLYQMRCFLGRHRDEMADAVIEAVYSSRKVHLSALRS
jgi:hypothetical protein